MGWFSLQNILRLTREYIFHPFTFTGDSPTKTAARTVESYSVCLSQWDNSLTVSMFLCLGPAVVFFLRFPVFFFNVFMPKNFTIDLCIEQLNRRIRPRSCSGVLSWISRVFFNKYNVRFRVSGPFP